MTVPATTGTGGAAPPEAPVWLLEAAWRSGAKARKRVPDTSRAVDSNRAKPCISVTRPREAYGVRPACWRLGSSLQPRKREQAPRPPYASRERKRLENPCDPRAVSILTTQTSSVVI